MADDDSRGRKPDFRTAAADIKAMATVLGRRLNLRSPTVLAAIGVVATLVLAVVVVMALLQTGDAKAVSNNAAVIGALVALGGVFTAQMVSIALDDRRTHEARDLEAQRAGEAALQNYFEAVGELLIEKPLHRASPGDKLSAVVRAQTLSVLEGLDPDRKRILLLFLYESGLIYKDKAVVNLRGANLIETNLSKAFAFMLGADLSNANLSNASLSKTNLIESNLSKALLSKANMRGAYLIDADLSNAYMAETDLSNAVLSKANLSGAHLLDADLSEADLSEADLSDANLFRANLSNANLSDANLSNAVLVDAILSGTTGITNEELEQHTRFLEGVIMPDGSKHP
jgi:hypothetical protein